MFTSAATGAPENSGTRTRQDTLPDDPLMITIRARRPFGRGRDEELGPGSLVATVGRLGDGRLGTGNSALIDVCGATLVGADETEGAVSSSPPSAGAPAVATQPLAASPSASPAASPAAPVRRSRLAFPGFVIYSAPAAEESGPTPARTVISAR
ncbi:hypothetical protein GCM10022236_44960 [Microlunatus ginsengisoli]|uniref:Uncharacterized protein n=1 Tax=Microlunatus ginsengisoli TaxID=363863 RepID=A0ABP7APD8_9ACTN